VKRACSFMTFPPKPSWVATGLLNVNVYISEAGTTLKQVLRACQE
jgi:hypothetical protein